jgi:hypothetical protein
MSYVDSDGDLILETTQELTQFMVDTPCNECRADAQEMLDHLSGVQMVKLVFATGCEHG